MAERTIFAFTRPGISYPPYINVTVQSEQKTVRVILRGDDGKSSEARFMIDEWVSFLNDQEVLRG